MEVKRKKVSEAGACHVCPTKWDANEVWVITIQGNAVRLCDRHWIQLRELMEAMRK